MIEVQRDICAQNLSDLAVYCGLTDSADDEEAAVDAMMNALKALLKRCGLPVGCKKLDPSDFSKLVGLIDKDSINYSPSVTFTDREIRALLRQIRKGG